MKKVDINKLAPHPDNPRTITEDKLEKLKSSLEEFQDMTEVRPLVVNKQGQVLGGNMRLRAMIELGWKKAPVIEVDWKEDKQREFMIKDNAGFGNWDYDELANNWDSQELNDWGVDVWSDADLELDDFFEDDETESKEETKNPFSLLLTFSSKDELDIVKEYLGKEPVKKLLEICRAK